MPSELVTAQQFALEMGYKSHHRLRKTLNHGSVTERLEWPKFWRVRRRWVTTRSEIDTWMRRHECSVPDVVLRRQA